MDGIDYVLWINMERSVRRRQHMETMLSKYNVPNIRIEAIDGNVENTRELISPLIQTEDNLVTACALSHIKALSKIKDLPGEYFLILEDDVSDENFHFFKNTSLGEIIKSCPDFDVLLLNKMTNSLPTKLYTRSEEFDFAWSTAAYVVPKKNIENICKHLEYKDGAFVINVPKFYAIDIMLHDYVNTYVYKYNYFDVLCEDSQLHPDHIPLHIQFKNANKALLQQDFGLNQA